MQETLTLNGRGMPVNQAPKQRPSRREPRHWLFLAGVFLLVLAAWLIGTWGGFEPGSAVGYNLGLAGGIMMLVLFLYPLRKHFRLMHKLGPAKYWFALHMAMGILGPLFILAHSRFQIGSINAGVALASMSLVAGSGIVGRFIYTKIHHGLYGHRASLNEVRGLAGMNSEEIKSKLHFVPAVEESLRAFESSALQRHGNLLSGAWAFLTLSLRARLVYLDCARELKRFLKQHARTQGWDAAKYQRRLMASRRVVLAYLQGVRNVAHFSTYERLFSLWHVLHVPLVYMLVLSAVAHVVAVHMY